MARQNSIAHVEGVSKLLRQADVGAGEIRAMIVCAQAALASSAYAEKCDRAQSALTLLHVLPARMQQLQERIDAAGMELAQVFK